MKKIIITIITKEIKKKGIVTDTSNHWCELVDDAKLEELLKAEQIINSVTTARMHIKMDEA